MVLRIYLFKYSRVLRRRVVGIDYGWPVGNSEYIRTIASSEKKWLAGMGIPYKLDIRLLALKLLVIKYVMGSRKYQDACLKFGPSKHQRIGYIRAP